jgi:hypothetical protein
MRKIINGKAYDTDKAKAIGREWESTVYVTDFDYYCEQLYRKRTGEYFLHGQGNAASKYSRSEGNNSWTGGSAIIPLTYESAREWAEKHLDAEEYEAEFGVVDESDEQCYVSLKVPAHIKAALDRECARTGKTRTEVIIGLLSTLA